MPAFNLKHKFQLLTVKLRDPSVLPNLTPIFWMAFYDSAKKSSNICQAKALLCWKINWSRKLVVLAWTWLMKIRIFLKKGENIIMHVMACRTEPSWTSLLKLNVFFLFILLTFTHISILHIFAFSNFTLFSEVVSNSHEIFWHTILR